MKNTQPVFVIGTGRCGTRAIYKMLLGTPGVEVHHEYLLTHIQQLAALYSMGISSRGDAQQALELLYGAAVELSDAAIWVDCSNKASWLIEPLRDIFPNARFVVLYRDGRKVTSSFFHKLAAEVYGRAWRRFCRRRIKRRRLHQFHHSEESRLLWRWRGRDDQQLRYGG